MPQRKPQVHSFVPQILCAPTTALMRHELFLLSTLRREPFDDPTTIALEAALSSLRREFFSKHYVLGGSVEVPILQSILWPFLQDKVLPTTTLSNQSTVGIIRGLMI